MQTMNDFKRILGASQDLAADLPGHVFIGGVAIYLHTVNSRSQVTRKMAEASHDSDLMMSLRDYSSLREIFEVVSNARLGKHQAIIEGVEFDVYVERKNNLSVPYDDIFAHASTYDRMRVASLEHLLLLKLAAHEDRQGSAKGDKDERDIVNLSMLMRGKPRRDLLAPYLRDDHVASLERIVRGRVFTDLCRGNVHDAKKMRQSFEKFVQVLKD